MGAPPAGPCVLVIFGATGDLTRRLLIPAMYNLRRSGLLPKHFAIVGIARADKDSAAFRRDIEQDLREAGDTAADADWNYVAERISYLQGAFDDPKTFTRLKQLLARTDAEQHTAGNYLFYLATPPAVFAPLVQQLGAAGLVQESDKHWRRVIVEKPFGTDVHSAQELNRQLLTVLSEDQIYRIDHYLGKETVQNIMVFRFGNGMFEPLWNRDHIDHVQITVAEAVDIGRRGKFYDATGALRDMVPNHLFQLFTLIAMEPPVSFDAHAVRSEKAKVLQAVHRLSADEARRNVVRGQYGGGRVNGTTIAPYRKAASVAPSSGTETYVAMKLAVDNWRWAGVPFYLRTGKALAARRTEIVIQFKQAPFALFHATPVHRLMPNNLVLQIQPEEGVILDFSAKIPGPDVRMRGVEMKFNYGDYFSSAPNTGYETLIYDCMRGDATLFQRADNIEYGWEVVQPILDLWAQDRAADVPIYAAGSAGPDEAQALLTKDGRHWRPIEARHQDNKS